MEREQRVALITGGGSGIGFATTRALLERGWSVAVCGRDTAKLSRAVDELKGWNAGATDRLFASTVDVSLAEDVQSWIAEACDRFGSPDLLVNNAGVGLTGEIEAVTEKQWDLVMDVNLKGVFLCTREVLPRMRSAGGGWIINIASLSGKRGMSGVATYCASKFGVVGFTESLAREEAKHNIRATSICPGYVATPMVVDAAISAEEMIQPEDIAATVLYLLELSSKTVIREIVVERIGGI